MRTPTKDEDLILLVTFSYKLYNIKNNLDDFNIEDKV